MGKKNGSKNNKSSSPSPTNKTEEKPSQAEAAKQALAQATSSSAVGDTAFITSSSSFVPPTTTTNNTKPPTTAPAATSSSSTLAAKSNSATASKKSSFVGPTGSKTQNTIYGILVILSIASLMYLVFVSMQPVTFSPCTLLNGTWFVSEEDAALNPLLVGKYSGNALASDNLLNVITSISGVEFGSFLPERVPSEYELAEKAKIEQNLVQVDLNEFVEVYGAANDSLRLPVEALPIDLAPRHVEPLYIRTLSQTYNGGAKTHWWTGACKSKNSNKKKNSKKSSSSSSPTPVLSKCTLMILRGHWALTVFPLTDDELADTLKQASSESGKKMIPSPLAALEPYTVVGTRLDSNEVAEEVVFNRKVKYVMILMGMVALIHYGLSAVQPKNPMKVRRDAALAKLLEIEKQKLAQAQAQKKKE